MKVPEQVFNYDMLISTKIYLIFTLSTITIVLYNERIIARVNKVQEYDKPNDREVKQLEFTKLFINKNNAKFGIYVFYFFILVVTSIITLNKIEVFENKDLMSATLQSFATYIAFERIINNTHIVGMSKRDLLTKLLEVFKTYR